MSPPAPLVIGSILTGLLLSACGHNLHASPPGLADHQPGNLRNAPANQPGGSCSLLTSSRIQASFAGQVSTGVADNLTPGLDRCNWTITHSRLSPTPLVLAVFRPVAGKSGGASRLSRGTLSVPALGSGATYSPATMTLTYTRAGKATSFQLITGTTIAKSGTARVQSALVKLAAN